MAVTQYIGARYVPIFADPVEWSDTKSYEPLTIVTHEGASYTSRQSVPIGIDLTDTRYWVLTGNYDAQVEQYRQEVERYEESIRVRLFAFGSVEDMSEDRSLFDGAYALVRNEALYLVTDDSATYDGVTKVRCGDLTANLVGGDAIDFSVFDVEQYSDVTDALSNLLGLFSNVSLGGGHYRCASLTLPMDSTLTNGILDSVNEGTYTDGIIVTDNASVLTLANNATVDGVSLKNFTIYANGRENVEVRNCDIKSGHTTGGAIGLFTCNKCVIENCEIHGSNTNAVCIHTCRNITIKSSELHTCGHSGVWSPYSKYVNIYDCKAHGNKYDGFDLNYGADDSTISIDAATNVRNCEAYENDGCGFFICGSNIAIESCNAHANVNAGIKVARWRNSDTTKAKNIVITDNVVSNNATNPNLTNEIELLFTTDSTVSGNMIESNNVYGLYLDSASVNCVIEGNIFVGCKPNSYVYGNFFVNNIVDEQISNFTKLWGRNGEVSGDEITLNSSNYDWLVVYYQGLYNHQPQVSFFRKGVNLLLTMFALNLTPPRIAQRLLTRSSDTKYTIGNAIYCELTTGATGNDANYALPMAIFGLKI